MSVWLYELPECLVLLHMSVDEVREKPMLQTSLTPLFCIHLSFVGDFSEHWPWGRKPPISSGIRMNGNLTNIEYAVYLCDGTSSIHSSDDFPQATWEPSPRSKMPRGSP